MAMPPRPLRTRTKPVAHEASDPHTAMRKTHPQQAASNETAERSRDESPAPSPALPDHLEDVEALLAHFEQIEAQFQALRDGLTHSHRLATLGTIATMIAHEYNNILTPVVSYCQMAQARPNDHALMAKAVEKSLQGALRAARISSSLLGFAREADNQPTASLRQTLDEALNCLARDPARDGIAIQTDIPDVNVAMSPLNLQQVMLNLILNARKAMRQQGGTLFIQGRLEHQQLHMEVRDTGPGIPPAILGRLFEPFVTHPTQGDAADSFQHQGTGLGLCICRDLVMAAGGSISVTSPPGKGACFHLTLPAAGGMAEEK